MPILARTGIRPGFLLGALGVLCLLAGPSRAAYTPTFSVPLNGFSTNDDPSDPDYDPNFQHPIGELGFFFFQGGDCATDRICLDLAIQNATATAPAGQTGVQSSRMVSAGFDVPGLWDGSQFLDSPPAFGGLSLANPATDYISNPSGYGSDPLNTRPGAFTQLEVNGNIPGLASFDLCPGISDCLSGGSPNTGLANGESTIVRFLFSYDTSDPAVTPSSVADAFLTYYQDVDGRHTGGRWKAITYTYCVSDSDPSSCTVVTDASDKIAGGPPQPPGPPEDKVPGPLPLMGAAAAFGFSRRLRHRIAAGRERVPSLL